MGELSILILQRLVILTYSGMQAQNKNLSDPSASAAWYQLEDA